MFWTLLVLLVFIVRNLHYGVKDWDLPITANATTMSILFAAALQPAAGDSKAVI